ncbi:MAG: NADH-quinone oxidoreductase subunit M [Verrucomicrobiia bacterium]
MDFLNILNGSILTPLVFAAGLCFMPARKWHAIRWLAILGAFITVVLSGLAFAWFNPNDPGFQFVNRVTWVSSLDMSWHVGADGISVVMVLLTGIVGFAATLVSWDITSRQKEFYVLLLLMIAGAMGMFASLDIFFIYFFHELALIPTFLMIGIWGSGKREYAAMKMTLYLSAGAFVALIGLIALYVALPAADRTFNLPTLLDYARQHPLSANVQRFIYPFLLFGLGTLVSLVPFHTWAPIGYACAPTATAMFHAGVLKKFGLYALIRIALPLLPVGAHDWNGVLLVLLLCNIVYAGLVAMTQKNFNYLLGYSSVAHMGFAFLGIASFTFIGLTGAVLVMFAHGIMAALAFGLSGYFFAQTGTREIKELGGLCRPLPFVGTLLVMTAFASVGLPGFANFAGEVMVLFGTWQAPAWHTKIGAASVSWPVLLALWGGAVIGAVYMLRAMRNICFGPTPSKWQSLADANIFARVPYVLLLGVLIWVGCYPKPFVEAIKPATGQIITAIEKAVPAVAPKR